MATTESAAQPVHALEGQLRELLAAEPAIAAAYLFGSHARGQARADSDLDIGVVYQRREPTGAQHAAIAARLGAAIGRALGVEEVDVVDLEAQGPLFCHEVLLDGRLVHEADRERRVDFESDTVVRAIDFRPTYELATRGKVSALRRWLRERR